MARSKARKLADMLSGGNALDDGVISASEVVGLGTAATTAATDYATAAQGTLAASALQPTGDGSGLTGISGAAESIKTYATAPSVGAEGSVYYNTTGDVLFISNGSAWKEIIPQAPTTTGGTVTLAELTYGLASFSYALGTDFSDQVTSDANFTYTLTSGTLPSGVTISGVNLVWDAVTPQTGATYTFSITATDEDGLSSTQAYSQVQAGLPVNLADGSVTFTETSGTWTVPAGVFNISVVAVGAGGGGGSYNDGGGGGGLGYKNNITVSEGDTFTYVAATRTSQGPAVNNHNSSGGDSSFTGPGVNLIAYGGKSLGRNVGDDRSGGSYSGADGGGSGARGGYGGSHAFGPSYSAGGGGGAAGYSGANAGVGGHAWSTGAAAGTNGTNGGGGGGGGAYDSASGGYVYGPNMGGSVGLNGVGTSGSGGNASGNGSSGSGNPSASSGVAGSGGGYGAGGGGAPFNQGSYHITRGGVRIVWKINNLQSFPSNAS